MNQPTNKTPNPPFPEFSHTARQFVNRMNEIDKLFRRYGHPSAVLEKEEERLHQELVATAGLKFLSWCFENEVNVEGSEEQLAHANLSEQERQELIKFLGVHKVWAGFTLRSYRQSEGYYNELTGMSSRHFLQAKNQRFATYLRLRSFDRVLECQFDFGALAAGLSSILRAMQEGLAYANNIRPSLGKDVASNEYVNQLKDAAASLVGEIEARQKSAGSGKK